MPRKATGPQINLICDSARFMIAKDIIRSQSKQLGLMMETKTYEHKPRDLIYLAGTSADELEKLKLFFKTGSYINPQKTTNKPVTIIEAIQMFVLGDKYGIGNLKDQAKNNLKDVLDPDWNAANFMIALEAICTNLPATAELKDMVLVQVSTFKLPVAMKLFDDYENGGFNDVCDQFMVDGVDIRRELADLQEKVLKEEETRHVGVLVPGVKCPFCKEVDMLHAIDSTKGKYFCMDCNSCVNGRVPGEWIR